MARKRRIRSATTTAHTPSCALAHDEDGNPSEDALKEHIEREIQPMIAARGFAVQHIDSGDIRTGFCYTVGLTDRGYPELLVRGFHPVMSLAMLYYLGEHLLKTYGPGEVQDRTRLVLPIGPDESDVPFWLLAPTPEQDENEGPGVAKAYYQRWVPHLRVKPAGWPCGRCTAHYDQRTRCTCKFACTWHACALQDGTVPIEELPEGGYKIGLPPSV
jgi:hypothetical protein